MIIYKSFYVYSLYGLTYEEVMVIDTGTDITEEDMEIKRDFYLQQLIDDCCCNLGGGAL